MFTSGSMLFLWPAWLFQNNFSVATQIAFHTKKRRSEGSEGNSFLYFALFPPFLPLFVRIIICYANSVSHEETKKRRKRREVFFRIFLCFLRSFLASWE